METMVASWRELHECLYEGSWQDYLGRYRSHYGFRGLQNVDYDLKTSLMRLGDGCEAVEAPLLRTFKKYAKRDITYNDSEWNWLALAQHHGLPTRLLDWTYSPYVALHFATANVERFDLDGVIWCLDHVKVREFLPDTLKAILKEERADAFTVEMLNEGNVTLESLDKLSPEPFVMFLEPPSLDDRIVNQFALFSLMSHPTALLNHWLAAHPDLYRKIIIPASLKWEIRDKLDQANISERVLFPGLDGLSQMLKRYYTPKQR